MIGTGSPPRRHRLRARLLARLAETTTLIPPLFPPFFQISQGGLSLQSQYLTAAFLGIRLLCSFMMEYDIHTLLDFLTLAATGEWEKNGEK